MFYYKRRLHEEKIAPPGFEPMTFLLKSSCKTLQGITFLIVINISPDNQVAPIYSPYYGEPKSCQINNMNGHQQQNPEPVHPME